MNKHKTAVIFAGGRSTRMGQDKALLPFAPFSTLSEFQFKKLSLLFSKVYLSAKEDKFTFTCPVIQDTYEESSPLVGLISIFEMLEVEEVFILSVDAPFINDLVIHTLFKQSRKDSDATVAQSPSGIQPLCGIYAKSILPLAYKQLEKNNHKLLDLLSLAETLYVPFEDDTLFTNLNHPEEYAQALKLLKGYSKSNT